MVQTQNSENNNPPDPIGTQLAAITVKLGVFETMKEDIVALKEGERIRSRSSRNDEGESSWRGRQLQRPYNKIDFPNFRGGDPRGWLLKAGKYFSNTKYGPSYCKEMFMVFKIDGKQYKLQGVVSGPQKSSRFQHLAIDLEIPPCIPAPLQPIVTSYTAIGYPMVSNTKYGPSYCKEMFMVFKIDEKQYKLQGVVSGPQKSSRFQHLAIDLEIQPCIPAPLQPIVTSYMAVFEEPQDLPPTRSQDYSISLLPNSTPPNIHPYRWPHSQKVEIEKQVEQLMAIGFIPPSTIPFSSPVLLVKKKDNTWATVFLKLDLRSGYYQIRCRLAVRISGFHPGDPVFHILMLKLAHGSFSSPPVIPLPITKDWEIDLEPNSVITYQWVYEAGQPVLELLITWCNQHVEEATWKTYDLVAAEFRLKDKAFYREHPRQMRNHPLGNQGHRQELPGFKYRHDLVRDVLYDVLKRAGISSKKEAPVNFLTDPLEGRSTLRPADILVFGWTGGKHACVDLTGVSPLVGFRENGFVAGQAALKAESSKVAKHEKACLENQHVFIPFAFDTFGFLAPKTEKFLNRVQRVVQSNCSTPKAQNIIFSRIGFAIQKGVAAQLVARLPAILL
nr:putative exostosin-like protein [Tanacetum cinerariifolium]